MVESGKVVRTLKNGYCVVSFDRRSACDQCHMCAVTKNGKKVEITASNAIGAEVGDNAEVTMADGAVLTSAVIVYVIPLILVAMGVFLGSFINELAQILFVLAGLVVGFGVAIWLGKVIKNKKGFAPIVTKIIKEQQDTEEIEVDE